MINVTYVIEGVGGLLGVEQLIHDLGNVFIFFDLGLWLHQPEKPGNRHHPGSHPHYWNAPGCFLSAEMLLRDSLLHFHDCILPHRPNLSSQLSVDAFLSLNILWTTTTA